MQKGAKPSHTITTNWNLLWSNIMTFDIQDQLTLVMNMVY